MLSEIEAKVPVGGGLTSEVCPQQARVPSVLTPQTTRVPTLTAVKVSEGGVESPTVTKLPEQATVPSVLIPHSTESPVLTEVNVPFGGSTRPCSSVTSLQHDMVPSVSTSGTGIVWGS
jgi:hypothetical protein